MNTQKIIRGPTEYGYRYVPGTNQLEKDPREQEIINLMIRMYTADPPITPNAIAKHLNQKYQHARVYFKDRNHENNSPQNLQYSKFYANTVTNCLKRAGVFKARVDDVFADNNLGHSKVTRSTDLPEDPQCAKKSNLTPVVRYFKRARLEELQQRLCSLGQNSDGIVKVAITGVAGCGKSELAKAYAYEFTNSHNAFRWRLDPDPVITNQNTNQVAYDRSYAKLLHNFKLTAIKAYSSETPEDLQERLNDMLWMKIKLYSPWVVIFDNAEHSTTVERYLPMDPSIKGTILVTTRTPYFWIDSKEGLNFSINRGLDEKNAVELLEELSGQKDQNIAGDLSKKLDHSPLGIRVAASYMVLTDTSMKDYCQMLDSEQHEYNLQNLGIDFVNQATGAATQGTLRQAIEFSIHTIKNDNPEFYEILRYCAYLDNHDIPYQLLLELFKQQSGLKESIAIEDRWKSRIIKNYSLLTYDYSTKVYSIHRTTQKVLKKLDSEPVKVIGLLAGTIMNLYPYDGYSIEQLKACQKIEPHLVAIEENIASDPRIGSQLSADRYNLLFILGKIGYEFSNFTMALEYLQKAKSLTDDPDIGIEVSIYLANTYYSKGEYGKSRDILNDALKIYKKRDRHLAEIYNFLGDTLRQDAPTNLEQCKLEEYVSQEVKPKYHHAIYINQSHSEDLYCGFSLAYAYRGLGHCYRDVGGYSEAYKNYKKSIDIYLELQLSLSNPIVTNMYRHIGTLGLYSNPEKFVDVGMNYSDSLRSVDTDLRIKDQVYGRDSYEVALSYYWMSRLLYVSLSYDHWDRALICIDMTLEIDTRIIGKRYHGLINSYYWKAKILRKLSRDQEAKAILERLRILHPNSRMVRAELLEMVLLYTAFIPVHTVKLLKHYIFCH